LNDILIIFILNWNESCNLTRIIRIILIAIINYTVTRASFWSAIIDYSTCGEIATLDIGIAFQLLVTRQHLSPKHGK